MRSSKEEKAVGTKDLVTTCERSPGQPAAEVPVRDAATDGDSAFARVIGLTGGIGTGKSTAAAYLVSQGLVHVDADAISRRITEKRPGEDNPVLEEIDRAFDGMLRPDGSLDRKRMADLVFHDPAKKKRLEDILFRHIVAEIHRQIDAAGQGAAAGQSAASEEEGRNLAAAGSGNAEEACPNGRPLVLLDVPLLFESGLDSLCERVIVLTADEETRINRVTARDGCSPEDVQARMANQMPDADKCARADYVVDNSGSLEDLQAQLDRVLGEINFPY